MSTPATPAKPLAAPFTRYHHPDPVTERIVQDIYDKLNAIWAAVNQQTAK